MDAPQPVASPLTLPSRGLLRNGLWNLLAFLVSLPVGLLVTRALVRTLGPGGYGILAAVAALTGYFAALDLGLPLALTRSLGRALGAGDKTSARAAVATGLWAHAALGAVGALVAGLLCEPLLTHLVRPDEAERDAARAVLFLSAAGIAFGTLGAGMGAILAALQRFDLTSCLRMAQGLLSGAAILVVLGLGYGLPAVAAVQLGATVLGLFAAAAAVRAPHGPPLACCGASRSTLAELLRFAGAAAGGRLAGNWFFLVDRTVLAASKGPAAVAGYAVPYSLTALLHGGVGSAASALFPASTHLAARGDEEALRALYVRAARMVTAAAAPISAFLLLLPEAILEAWIGKDFALQHAPVLAILAATFFLHSFNIVPFVMTEGLGHPRVTAAFAAASTALNLAGCLWLVPAWGPAGAAWANLLSTAPLLPFLWWFWTSCLGIAGPARALRQVLSPLPAVLPVVLFLASARHLATSLPRQAAIGAACAGLYLASTWWLSAAGRQDIRDGLRAMGLGRGSLRSA